MTRELPPLGENGRTFRTFMLWPIGLIAVLLVIGVVAFLGGCVGGGDDGGGGGNESTSEVTPTPSDTNSPQQALEQYIREQLGKEYAGDCSTSIVPPSEGKVCSAAKGERGNKKAYLVGVSSFEFNLWVFLANEGRDWKVESAQPVKAETANVPGAPWPLQKGAKVIVLGTGNCLNVRSSPGIKEAAVDCLADGTTIVLEEGPIEMDGFQWWRPQDRSGWVAGDWLRYPDESATPTAAAPTPTPQP